MCLSIMRSSSDVHVPLLLSFYTLIILLSTMSWNGDHFAAKLWV